MANTTTLQIKCPHCGNKFSPEAALEHDVRQHLEKEYDKKLEENSRIVEQRIKKSEGEKYLLKIKSLESDREAKTARLLELEEKSLTFQEREQKLRDRENQMEIELRKRLLEREKLLGVEADRRASEKAKLDIQEKQQALDREKQNMEISLGKRLKQESDKIREEEQMKAADLQKKLNDQTQLINEMKRKSEQGSMQAQGEVQELAIEEFLKTTFVRDEIEEIAKGKRGGDCVHHVKDCYGNLCGKILYESKRTRNFGGDWPAKLKEDMRLTQADIGVIVTEALPGEMTRFGQYEGIWVCTFAEFKALSVVFRESLQRIGEVRTAQENRGEKMQLLYEYLTSVEFRQKLEAIVEAFQQMQVDLNKEKAQTLSHWAKREKQIFKVMENTVSLYGDVRGIAGTAIKEIAALEIEEVKLLVEK
ncbi:MAG: DUF2130 domain-containing protein [Cyclobacteriaceae bacterium]